MPNGKIIDKIRDEKKFDNLEELKTQIEKYLTFSVSCDTIFEMREYRKNTKHIFSYLGKLSLWGYYACI